MSIIYVTKDNASITIEGKRIIVKENGEYAAGVPAKLVDGIVVTSDANITTKVIRQLLRQDSYIVYTDWQGKYCGMTINSRINFKKRSIQYEAVKSNVVTLKVVKYLVRNKIFNQIEILKVFAKYRKNSIIKLVSEDLLNHIKLLESAKTVNEVRGIEGISAKDYFSTFGEIVDASVSEWNGRNRQPARDPINAALNFGYAFLEREVRLKLLGCGLDEQYGFLHTSNGRKDSFVYDCMELFRQPIIDRLVLNCFGRKSLKRDDFIIENNGCIFTDKGKKKWIENYEKWVQSEEHNRDWIEEEINNLVEFMEKSLEENK